MSIYNEAMTEQENMIDDGYAIPVGRDWAIPSYYTPLTNNTTMNQYPHAVADNVQKSEIPFAETWLVKEFIRKNNGTIRLVDGNGFYIFSDGLWAPDTENRGIRTKLITFLENIKKSEKYEEMLKSDKTLRRWLTSTRALPNLVKDLVSILETEESINITKKSFDTFDYYLKVANGIVDLRTRKLIPDSPEKMMTLKTTASYIEGAPISKLWLSFLNDVMEEDQEMISFLQRAVGYTLTGSQDAQCIFYLLGTGQNGKSVFINTLRMMLGTYACPLSSTELMDTPYPRGHTEGLVRLGAKRMAFVDEFNSSQKINASIIKRITGYETLDVRTIYKEGFELDPKVKLWMQANHPPKFGKTDDGIFRRTIIIEFPKKIKEAERKNTLLYELGQEIDGILTWAVEGAIQFYNNGNKLVLPQKVTDKMDMFEKDTDNVSFFIKEQCDQGRNLSIRFSMLYEAYEAWCYQMDSTPKKKSEFNEDLRRKGFTESRVSQGQIWESINLKK